MADFVLVRNAKGQEKTMSVATWNLLRNKNERGNTRKGWTLVGPAPQGKAGAAAAAQPQGPTASFLPKEITEEQRPIHEAEVAKEATMISAEAIAPATEATAAPVKPADEAPAPSVVEAPAAPETPAPAPPAAKEPAAPVKADDLASLPNLGAAVAKVLSDMGIVTYRQLVDASLAEINKALDASKFGAKKAQVPTWRMKAAELIK